MGGMWRVVLLAATVALAAVMVSQVASAQEGRVPEGFPSVTSRDFLGGSDRSEVIRGTAGVSVACPCESAMDMDMDAHFEVDLHVAAVIKRVVLWHSDVAAPRSSNAVSFHTTRKSMADEMIRVGFVIPRIAHGPLLAVCATASYSSQTRNV